MPKDDWKPTRDRDAVRRLNQPSPIGKHAHKRAKRERQLKAIDEARRTAVAPRITADTPIWFGEHEGTALRDLPEDYRRWLAELNSSKPEMQHLACFLRTFNRQVPPR